LRHDRIHGALDDANLDGRNAAARGLQVDGERRLDAEELRDGAKLGADAGHALPPREVGHGGDHEDERNREEDEPGLPAKARHGPHHSKRLSSPCRECASTRR
jgi:hypothetical protein